MDQEKKDFFISYTGADRQWAEWIAWHLEDAGYTTIIQAWDFRVGGNFILEMHRAAKETSNTIAVLSEKYQQSLYTQPEWAAALVNDPTGKKRLLLPVRIEDIKPEGLLAPVIYIDLAGLPEDKAKEQLLKDIKSTLSAEPSRPETAPDFPRGNVITPTALTKQPRFPGTLPPVWNLPRRNPNFTGRNAVLDNLRQSLSNGQTTAVTQSALYGLGGIGKSQLAIEYAYRFSSSYDVVWWLRSEEPSSLATDYTALAPQLNIEVPEGTAQPIVVDAVRDWLDHHQGWLLVFDNAVDVKSLSEYLPRGAGGHALITSRNYEWKQMALPLEITVWDRGESIAFLHKRTGQDDDAGADAIAEELGDLPLALEQAAVYMDKKGKGYADYLRLFTSRREKLWEKEESPDGYKEKVATTWSLAFEEVENVPLAQPLLHLSSFTAPDAIPQSLMLQALGYTGEDQSDPQEVDEFAFDEAIAALRSYSLITMEPASDVYDIHRLVQTVIRDRIDNDDSNRYRVALLNTLSEQFSGDGYDNPSCWPAFEQLLSHAERLIEEETNDGVQRDETSSLLNNMGSYYHCRTLYAKAEPLYQRALEIWEKQLGPDHPEVAISLNNLAVLLKDQGKYGKAEPLCQRALAIREKQLGPDHPEIATSLNTLAALLQDQGKYCDAEPLYRRALGIDEKALGPEHLNVASSLNNLASLLQAQGKSVAAEPLYRRSLEIIEKQLGSEHPLVASSLNNLASLLKAQGKYCDAEPLYQRALAIREKQLSSDHPDVAISLNNLALLLKAQGKYGEAEPLSRRALAIREKHLGPNHPSVANSLNNLASLLKDQGKYGEAEPLYQRSLAICEKQLGPEHPDVATNLNNLALLLQIQGKYSEAEPLCRRALGIDEKALGPEHPSVASSLNNLASLLQAQGKSVAAEPLYRRSLEIIEKQLSSDHPDVATILYNLAGLLKDQGKYGEAEPLCRRTLKIMEKSLGTLHPHTIMARKNLTILQEKMEKE